MSSVLMQKGFQHCLPGQLHEEERNDLNKTKVSTKLFSAYPFQGLPAAAQGCSGGVPQWSIPVWFGRVSISTRVV